jgi:hypothetical protein
MSVTYIDNYNPDGTCLGQAAADKIGFYGTTPAIQPASASQALVTKTAATALATTVFSAASTGMWAFASSTVAKTFQPRINQCVVDIGHLTTLVNKIRADLVTIGIIKGAA